MPRENDGIHMNSFLMQRPDALSQECLTSSVRELISSAREFQPFGVKIIFNDPRCYGGADFRSVIDSRFDALPNYLQGISRKCTDSSLNPHPIVQCKDETAGGKNRVIPKFCEAVADGHRTGQPCQSRLDSALPTTWVEHAKSKA